ncbi:MAG: ATP-binding cassette domain-containing protein [Oscillospiraceae bacterium]|nr:ATP-binding cassette domain-containing protein [Oscillospiraceae bacterium]
MTDRGAEKILSFENVTAGYGRSDVLNGLSFEVERGEVFGIIGPNGSGKTTMLNTLTGLLRPKSGRILLDGEDISRLPVDARCRRGIGRTFQIPRPFIRMTVFENVLVSGIYGAGFSAAEGKGPAEDVLRFTGLYEKRDLKSGELTLLDRKRLEIARAIVSKPRLLLLDEVAAGLTGSEIETVIGMVVQLKRAGFTVVWIEHILETMLKAADRLMCMAEGRCAVIGVPGEVLASGEVEELYLGTETEALKHAAR